MRFAVKIAETINGPAMLLARSRCSLWAPRQVPAGRRPARAVPDPGAPFVRDRMFMAPNQVCGFQHG
jgi:hypothetical protein